MIDLGCGRHGFFVGDVSGKGISAALLATLLQGVFFTTAAMDIPICDIFSRVNQYLSERIPLRAAAPRFSMVCASARNGEFEYVNAGHVPPLIRCRHAGELDAVWRRKNLAVGIVSRGSCNFRAPALRLQPGEWIVIYTDGVTEAANATRRNVRRSPSYAANR